MSFNGRTQLSKSCNEGSIPSTPATSSLPACGVPQICFTFIFLRSLKDKGLYIGYTNNLKKRIGEHQKGEVFATKGRLPVKLIHYQAFISKKDATETEKYLKTTRGWERIKRMLVDTLKEDFI